MEALKWSIDSEATTLIGIRTAYIAYHIWLVRNAGVFEVSWQPLRLVFERAMTQAAEIMEDLPSDLILGT